MPTDLERAEEMHDQFKPGAQEAYLRHILSRTPADLQGYMKDLINQDLNPAPPEPIPTEATVTHGQSVPLENTDGSQFPVNSGTAQVSNSTLTAVRIAPASSMTVVRNGDNVVVNDAADAAVAGSPGVAQVSVSVLNAVKLTV